MDQHQLLKMLKDRSAQFVYDDVNDDDDDDVEEDEAYDGEQSCK